jgi:hypothetical protein
MTRWWSKNSKKSAMALIANNLSNGHRKLRRETRCVATLILFKHVDILLTRFYIGHVHDYIISIREEV